MPSAEFIAGWISGALGLVVGHPIDTIKVNNPGLFDKKNYQPMVFNLVTKFPISLHEQGGIPVVQKHPGLVRLQTQSRYRGILDCILKTYKKEGILGFFKGMSFPVGSVAISNSLTFGSYSNALLYLTGTECKDWKNPPQNHHVFLAGCISGMVQVYFAAPVDLIKVRLQNQTESFKSGNHLAQYRGPVYCAVTILKEEGIIGLYRGSTALLLRDVPTVGIYFLTYEVVCKWMTNKGEIPDTWTMLFAGGCAGTLGWAAANPMDVIKSRLQMDGMYGVQYRGIFDCICKSIKQEGISVLLKGLTINCLRAFPVNAVTFLGFEKLLTIL